MRPSTHSSAPPGDPQPLDAAKDGSDTEPHDAPARAASWGLLAVYMIAIAAAVAMVLGEAGNSQLELVTGSVQAWTSMPDICSAADARPTTLRNSS